MIYRYQHKSHSNDILDFFKIIKCRALNPQNTVYNVQQILVVATESTGFMINFLGSKRLDSTDLQLQLARVGSACILNKLTV